MAFQTNVLRGGQWVTEAVSIESVCAADAYGNKTASGLPQPPPPPQVGILTRTLVESHLANFILPCRLRSPKHPDLAFIGDRFLDIHELGEDEQLHHIIRKSDFKSRIRNACVLDRSAPRNCQGDDERGTSPTASSPGVKAGDEGEDVVMLDSSPPSQTTRGPAARCPPQMLLLAMENGDLKFLYLPQASGNLSSPGFIEDCYQNRWPGAVGPGCHLILNPTSRFVAVGCARDFFAVAELEPAETLSERHWRGKPLSPIKRFRGRAVHGVIQNMEFLHPQPKDDRHVILTLIIVREGRSHLVMYDWMAGDNLEDVFACENNGYRMPDEDTMPLFIIPLLHKSALMAVFHHHVSIDTGLLCGPPCWGATPIPNPPATPRFHGRDAPIWTAWCRPVRSREYFDNFDTVCLAREDGVILFLEADNQGVYQTGNIVVSLDVNISRAFACIGSLLSSSADMFVVGGDAGPGGVWKAESREPAQILQALPCWSPAVDFVTTDESSTSNQGVADGEDATGLRQQQQQRILRKPDRVFAASGRGTSGSVTEYRVGLQASIIVEFEFELGVKQAWLLPVDSRQPSQGFHLLLSMPSSSAVLRLSHDFAEVELLDAESSPYDMSLPTLTTMQLNTTVFHVNSRGIAVIGPGDRRNRFPFEFPAQTACFLATGPCATEADLEEGWIAASTYRDSKFQVVVSRLTVDHEGYRSFDAARPFDMDGEVSCLALRPVSTPDGSSCEVLVGIWKSGRPYLATGSVSRPQLDELVDICSHLGCATPTDELQPAPIEAITSMFVHGDTVVLGTQSGEVLAVRKHGGNSISVQCEKFGNAPARLSLAASSTSQDAAWFVCCEKELVLLRDHQPSSRHHGPFPFKSKHRVWAVDGSSSGLPAPPIDHAVAVSLSPGQADGETVVLIMSGPRMLFATLGRKPGPVPRQIPLGKTPTKMLYSRHLKCLIVAANTKDDRPVLAFIDPDSGRDVGLVVDKNDMATECLSGLKNSGDRILGLAEWKFRKEGSTWWYILVGTKLGRVLVLSTKKAEPTTRGGPKTIKYRLLSQKLPGVSATGGEACKPVYSVMGYEEVIIYCVGRTLQWVVLSLANKRLEDRMSFELSSPATSLRMANGKVVALTIRDSVTIIDPGRLVGASAQGAAGSGSGSGSGSSGSINSTSGAPGPFTIHGDAYNGATSHFIEIGAGQPWPGMLPGANSSLIMCAGRDSQAVRGLWVPWQHPMWNLELVFEAELAASVRRFRRGHTRPAWEQARHDGGGPGRGRLAATVDDAEVLGLSLDGSLRHFALLSRGALRFLAWVQRLTVAVEAGKPLTAAVLCIPAVAAEQQLALEDGDEGEGGDENDLGRLLVESDVRMRRDGVRLAAEQTWDVAHVDGDVLQRCVEKRALGCLATGSEAERAAHAAGLKEALWRLAEPEGGPPGQLPEEASGLDECVEMAYRVLEYFLRPVM